MSMIKSGQHVRESLCQFLSFERQMIYVSFSGLPGQNTSPADKMAPSCPPGATDRWKAEQKNTRRARYQV